MNFTTIVKEDIRQKNPSRGDEAAAELIGYLSMKDSDGDPCTLSAGLDDYQKKRMETFPPLRDFQVSYQQGELWLSFVDGKALFPWILEGDLPVRKAYVRGAFLATGNVTDPKQTYHFEIGARHARAVKCLKEILESFSMEGSILERSQKNHLFYVKDSQVISDLLTIMGAVHSTLVFEEQMVLKSARNDVNRKVNCETANLSKTIDAGLRQLRAIEKLQEVGIFEKLDNHLYETGLLRLANPDASLNELVRLSGNNLSKSGLNHRLKKLIELAEEL